MTDAGSAPADEGFSPEEFGIGRLFEATADAIVLVDARGAILLWNPAAARMFGYEATEALGMNVDKLVPPEYQTRHHAGIARYQATGHGRIVDSGKPYEVPALRKDGSRVWIDLTLSAVQHRGHHFALGILRDVTDRVDLRERKALDRKQLQDAYASLEAFSYVVSHDLKEPVRGLAAYLEELESDPDSPDRAEIIARAAASQRNLARMLDGLLEWSRTAMEPLDPTTVRVGELLRDPAVAAQWDALARERHADIRIDAEIPAVLANEALLQRVFGNLITNAIRHNLRQRPEVRVETGDAPLPGHVEIVVRDNGAGFPKQLLGSSLNVRDKPATLKGGFGLIITRRAVERLHGRLELTNPPEGGGVARVQLPAATVARRAPTLDERVRELV